MKHSRPKPQTMVSISNQGAASLFQQLFASINVRLFVFVVALLCCILPANSMPSPLLYNGQEIERADEPALAAYRLYYLNNSPPPQMRTMQAKRDKKYDRNCFFSPVQCMLSYNANANDVIYHPSGRR
ncbi:hypothetical protein M3Y97_01094700 [Aphelenchoides bicaudatus]|nr:hypothetical protein M3Y97_01094700 [Aphelenchoides bicaudatus]